jgi:hypothetical protein
MLRGLSPLQARALLKVEFNEYSHARMHELSVKARAGALRANEADELTRFEELGCLLDIVHSLARRSIHRVAPSK